MSARPFDTSIADEARTARDVSLGLPFLAASLSFAFFLASLRQARGAKRRTPDGARAAADAA